MARIFLSHASANNAQALALADWLQSIDRRDFFLDIDEQRGIAPGERWMAEFTGAVERCEAVIFLLSPAWQKSKYCFAEFHQAEKLGKRLFGVIVEPIPMDELPDQLTSEWQLCDLTQGETRSFVVERAPIVARTEVHFSISRLEDLARGLSKAGLDPSTFRWPPDDDPKRSPYPGLRAMDKADAAVYFGRDAAIVTAIDRLRLLRERHVEQMFVVLGASGAGKSSFLRAGLLPRLERDSEHFLVLPTVRPARAVLSGPTGLLASLVAGLRAGGDDASVDEVRRALDDDPIALLRRLEAGPGSAAVRRPGPARTVVIPIDQAEELFVADGQAEVEQLRRCLVALQPLATHAAALRAGSPGRGMVRLLLVLTIRSDALPRLQADAVLQGLSPELFSLPAMPDTAFKEVIEGPAERHSETVAPLKIAPALVEQLVADAQGADALPLLALTLEWLYREFTTPQGTQIGPDEYARLGGSRGVIATAVGRALMRPGDEPAIPAEAAEQDRLMKELFPLIATIDPDSGAPRRTLARRETVRARPGIDALVSRLVEQRLLLADSRVLGAAGGPVEVVEIAHEALLRQWPLLERWLHERAADLAAAETLRRAAREWLRGDKGADLLVHKEQRLQSAQALADDEHLGPRFDATDREYLAACAECDARERRRRELEKARRHFTWAASAAALVFVVALGWTAWQSREIGQLNSHALASAAELAADQDRLDESLRLAILAARGHWLQPADASARSALARAADGNRLRLQLPEAAEAGGRTAGFSVDGRRILTASRDGRARLWDADTGRRLREFGSHEAALTTALLRRDGRQVLTASEDHSARLWDAETGAPLGPPMQHRGPVRAAAFSEDGRRLLTASGDGLVRVWSGGQETRLVNAASAAARVGDGGDGADGEGAADAVDAADGPAVRVAFSPDGQRALVQRETSVSIHDAGSGRRLVPPLQHCSRFVRAQISADGSRVVTADEQQRVRVWPGAPVAGRPVGDADELAGGRIQVLREAPVATVAISPDGTRFLAADADGGAIHAVSLAPEPPLGRLPRDGEVRDSGFGPDGQVAMLVSGSVVRLLSLAEHDLWGHALDHGSPVTAARFSPDGQWLATAGRDGQARLWEVRSGLPRPGLAPMRHGGPLADLALDAQRQRLATLGADGQVRLWSVADGRPLGKPLAAPRKAEALRFSPDGELLAAIAGGEVQVWRVSDGQPVRGWATLPGALQSLDLSADLRRVLTVSRDHSARLWDLASGRPLGAVLQHEGRLDSARFSADGRHVLTVSDDRTAQVWDGETGAPLGQRLRDCARITDAAFSPDSQQVVTASEDGSARLWKADSGAPDGEPLRSTDGPGAKGRAAPGLTAVRYVPDRKEIVTAARDGRVQRWGLSPQRALGEAMAHDAPVKLLALDADGRHVLTAGEDNVVRLWDLATGRLAMDPITHDKAVESVAFDQAGTRVLTVAEDGTRVYAIGQLPPPMSARSVEGAAKQAVFGAAGERVAVAVWNGRQHTGEVQVFRPGAPDAAPLRLRHARPVRAVAFGPGERLLSVVEGESQVRLWNLGRPEAAPSIAFGQEGAVLAAVFSPDGRLVATAARDRTARLWNADNGRPLGDPLRHHGEVTSVAFSADGSRLVTASEDGTAQVWDSLDGRPIGPPLRHAAGVRQAVFSPDGRRVATASWDRSARVWDSATGQPLGPPVIHEDAVYAVAFSRDGRLGTASRDGTARVWDADTGRPLGPRLKAGGEVNSVAFGPDDRSLLTAAEHGRVQLWPAGDGQVQLAGVPTLLQLACGRLNPPARRLTERDRRVAKVVAADQVGRDVCEGLAAPGS